MRGNQKGIDELARLCGVHPTKMENDMKRDFYLTASEATAYGLIDSVMLPNHPAKMMHNRGNDNKRVTYGHFVESEPIAKSADEPYIPPKGTILLYIY
jgi:hypothetical protein